MRYRLLIYSAEHLWTEQEQTACMLQAMNICKELEADGKWIPLRRSILSTQRPVSECEMESEKLPMVRLPKRANSWVDITSLMLTI